MFLLYDLIFLLYALIYLPYLLLTQRAYAGFGMRFGIFSPQIKMQIKAKANIWVHAVSVGEVMVLDGFIDRLRKTYPAHQVIASVTTKTGYALACERLKSKALVIPSPIDFSFVSGAFVSLIKPKIYIAVETEIWPNLYSQLKRQAIPIAVINGRISDKSFGRYKAIRFLLKGILNQVSVWCMQSQTHADRIIELGGDPLKVFVVGNLKFDDLNTSVDSAVEQLKSNEGELWWVAGSTWPGEEEIVLDVYSKILQDNPSWRLVIAPRHVERVPQIVELIAGRGFKAVKFTEVDSRFRGNDNYKKGLRSFDQIIIVDTIGHLRSLYFIASLVFVGKSLCVGGGHNIIEPAFYGKAIVIGPRFENFKDIVACFKEGQAIVQVDDAKALEIAVKDLCDNQSKREALGVSAQRVVTQNQGASQRSLERLAGYLK